MERLTKRTDRTYIGYNKSGTKGWKMGDDGRLISLVGIAVS